MYNNNNIIITKLIDLIFKNNLIFEDDFPSIFEKQYNEIAILNNKKLINITKSKSKIKTKKSSKIKKKIFEIHKIYKNNNSHIYNDSYKIEQCNYIYINKSFSKNDKPNMKINEKSSKNINNIPIINDLNNNFNRIISLDEQIKVKKNHKFIFMNKSLIKRKKKNFKLKENRNRRGIYRGVSKNGNKWQAILYYKGIGKYIGVYETQEIAARIYDISSIRNKGIKAKTNFKYNLSQIQKISESNIDYKSENIKEIISNLIN